ncbi:MAG: class I SAM-dependent methyltransferase [Methanomassiliicoccaceae archaeon]|nr:class I SAM-dependent methyltransferase [Methanomassiliicoccaceae archaeon]
MNGRRTGDKKDEGLVIEERHFDCDYGLFRRPFGEEGRALLKDMNEHHRKLSEWGLSVLPPMRCEKILDIGCGGGMLISLLADMFADSKIYGVDISEESVALTKEVNAGIVNEGRCHVSMASVSDLPFGDGSFDLVTAFETYFFWPDLGNDIKEAVSKIKSGGYLIVVSEMYPHPDFNERNNEAARLTGLVLRENDVIADLIEGCGMDVSVHIVERNNWVAFVGKKR